MFTIVCVIFHCITILFGEKKDWNSESEEYEYEGSHYRKPHFCDHTFCQWEQLMHEIYYDLLINLINCFLFCTNAVSSQKVQFLIDSASLFFCQNFSFTAININSS
jgi:hypothetical protein